MRYLVGIASKTYDLKGALLIPWSTNHSMGLLQRRVSRVKTLDGGVSVTDRGHSSGDRDITLSLSKLPPDKIETARSLVKRHGRVTVSTHDGCYLAVPSAFAEGSKELTLLITEKA